MSHKHALGPASLLLALLALALGSAPARASTAGPSGIRPLVEGEEPATLEKPADQGTPAGAAITPLLITGKELVELKAAGLPAGLELKKVSSAKWEVTGTPTTIAAAATVTLTGENPGHGAPAQTEFKWTVGGINAPAGQKTIVGAPVKVIVTGVELKTLTASPLPPGLEVKDVGGASETEWEITGAATRTGLTEVELDGHNTKGEALKPVHFNFEIVGAENPGPQTGTVGVALDVPIRGAELVALSELGPLPAGLKLEDPGRSESEWRIVGTPTTAGEAEVELQAEDPAKETELVKFTLTIAAAALPPPAPVASGTLAVTPAAAFAASRSSCGGASFSTGTVATQWLLDGAPIAGATAATYVAPRIDDGHSLSCRQTATATDGASTSLTSPGLTVHEQPPQPAWPIGPPSEHCAAALCMEDGSSAQTPPTRTYERAGSWLSASQVRCVSAPWTSIAGNSALASVEPFAEAHTVTVTLQRVTSAGVITLASEQLSPLGAPADSLDGTLAHSPFAGQIVAGYGAESFIAGELWPRVEPGSLGRPDRFAAGQGYIAYQLAGGPGVRRSFQLVYNLTSADLGARLRCVVAAEDGPLPAPTSASRTSPEYAVAKSSACAPRTIGHIGGPQPAVVLIGSRRCLNAQAGLPEIGGAQPGVSSVAGRSVLALECALAGGCSGRLVLAAAGHRLASVAVSLRQGARRSVSLTLDGQGRSRLRHAGAAGLPVTVTLAGRSPSRLLLAARLLNLT